jgi:tetratricopeptide (TPR) repeat protein
MKPKSLNQNQADLARLQREALLRPRDPQVAMALAQCLAGLHRTNEALRQFDAVLALEPKSVEARVAKAEIYKRIGDVGQAANEMRLVPVNTGVSAAVQRERARELASQQRFGEALEEAMACLSLNADYDGHFFCGQLQREIRNFPAAIQHFEKALTFQPLSYDAKYSLAETFIQAKKVTEAYPLVLELLATDPQSKGAMLLHAMALTAGDKVDEAFRAYEQLLAVDPDNADACSNFCCLLFDASRYDEAVVMGQRAVSLAPDIAKHYFNLANPLAGLGRVAEANTALEKAISLSPNYGEAHAKLGQNRLKMLDFAQGWSEFAQLPRPVQHMLGYRSWDGKSTDAPLLLLGDQGVGDQVLYCSMLHEIVERQINATVYVDVRLIPMLRRCFPTLAFASKDSDVSLSDGSWFSYLTSLGLFFRLDVASFAGSRPYVKDDAARTAAIKARLQFSGKKICGVSWSSKRQTWGAPKSFDLGMLAPVLTLDDWVFVNLQYGDTENEIKAVSEKLGVEIHSLTDVDRFHDLDGLLSIISACDMVVTSSNTTAHLAGARGVPTALILPKGLARIWYWQEVDGRSLWYPSVQVFSQAVSGDWTAPILHVRDLLAGHKTS